MCFCEGEACAGGENIGCTCEGTADCCCKSSNTCNYAHICQPSKDPKVPNQCLYRDGSAAECGSYGEFYITCGPSNGVVYSTCGSGWHHECDFTGMCPSGSYSGIRCGYKGLGTTDTKNQWVCGGPGQDMACGSSSPFLLGICGSGRNEDCRQKCVGYSGILCGTIPDVDVDQDNCYWKDQLVWGKFISCDDGYVGTGYCGSGGNHDCYNGIALARLKCCKLEYRNTTVVTLTAPSP